MEEKPKVNQVNEFLEIASDFENPLEIIREALSNAFDAGAENVEIRIEKNGKDNVIVIEDDGEGMKKSEVHRFFDLGNSNKEHGIGYKGHGTKIYYKSDKIKVETTKDSKKTKAVMEKPWKKLNNGELPDYSISSEENSEGQGTRVEIHNFRAGQGLKPEKLTYKRLVHYIKWKTVGGSTRHYFEDDPRVMDIEIILDDEIDSREDRVQIDSKFEFPEREDFEKFEAEELSKRFGPKVKTIEVEGEEYELQIVGMVGGKKARNELNTYGKHKSQFGLWFAKDHIKVERFNDLVSSDEQYIHYMFIVNCQGFELSANRQRIRNKSTKLFEEIQKEVKNVMKYVDVNNWTKDYFEKRKLEIKKDKIEKQKEELIRRHNKLQETGKYPKNEVEVLTEFVKKTSLGTLDVDIELKDYSKNSEVDCIVEDEEGLKSAAVDQNLIEYLEKEHPLSNLDYFICNNIGDKDELSKYIEDGYLGSPIELDYENKLVKTEENEIKIIEIMS